MKNKEIKLFHRIMTELYASATPPVDWPKLMEAPQEELEAFDYTAHYLDEDTFDQILNSNLGGSKLLGYQVRRIANSVHLGPSPTTVKK